MKKVIALVLAFVMVFALCACGGSDSGAANDIERATALARKMVTQFGMSDRFGTMALATVQNQYLEAQSYMECAQSTAATVDEEVQKLLQRCYEEATGILAENRGLLDEVALYLLAKETITGDELMAYVNADKQNKLEAGNQAE